MPKSDPPLVTRDNEVGLKTEFSGDGRLALTAVAVTSESSTGQERLDEELSIESTRSGVERASL